MRCLRFTVFRPRTVHVVDKFVVGADEKVPSGDLEAQPRLRALTSLNDPVICLQVLFWE